MNKTSGVFAGDHGGSTVCYKTEINEGMFPAVKGLFGKRNLINISGKYDYIVEYLGETYAMGTLAEYDCAYKMQMFTESKQHIFFDLSLLVAIHQFGYDSNYVIISVPIAAYNGDERFGLVERLLGEHTITVNGKKKSFIITDIKIAPETASAFWISTPLNKTRWLDIGSRTVGYATTVYDGKACRFIDTESGTFYGKGIEALDDNFEPRGLADFIYGQLADTWRKNDVVNILGGGANILELVAELRKYYVKATPMFNPQMANVNGMYELGKATYKMS